MLRLFASRIRDFQRLLAKPKSVPSSIATTFGLIEPLGFERFRICELYAELLHCSNMILLNDPRGEQVVKERDEERERLRREWQAKPAKPNLWGDIDLERGKGWIIPEASSGNTSVDSTPAISDMRTTLPPLDPPEPASVPQFPSNLSTADANPDKGDSRSFPDQNSGSGDSSSLSTAQQPRHLSEQEVLSERTQQLDSGTGIAILVNYDNQVPYEDGKPKPVVGDYLKMQFVDAKVLPSIVDLFFLHPWNNFLHNVVYDILTQVLNGPMDRGFNRHLVVDLFTTGQLTEKILKGQITSDEEQYLSV